MLSLRRLWPVTPRVRTDLAVFAGPARLAVASEAILAILALSVNTGVGRALVNICGAGSARH